MKHHSDIVYVQQIDRRLVANSGSELQADNVQVSKRNSVEMISVPRPQFQKEVLANFAGMAHLAEEGKLSLDDLRELENLVSADEGHTRE